MFCAKCGRKLSGKECKNCGTSAEIVDRCGGFFDLIDQEAAKQQPTPMAATGAPMVARHEMERILRKQKEEVEEEMKGKALIIVSAICAVLLVVVLVLSICLIGSGEETVKVDVEDIKEEMGAQGENLLPQLSAAMSCNCEDQGTLVEYKQYKSCNHEVICTMCDGRIRVEHCNIENGKCTLCEGHGNHTGEYEAIADAQQHRFVCEVCGLTEIADCNLETGSCGDCGRCGHATTRFVSNNDGTHTKKCEKCSADVGEAVECDYAEGTCKDCKYKCQVADQWEIVEDTDPVTGMHTHKCEVCGKEETIKTPDDGCTVCGAVKMG